MALIEATQSGFFCPQGGFYIDPSRGVEKAIVTHAHSDHARPGSASYLVPPDGVALLRARLGDDISAETLPYEEPVTINHVKVSLHPAGHILGSCMVRVEYRGEIWLISGDYKTESDPTCQPMAPPPRCHVFISESTFGLPIYRWRPAEEIVTQINRWWQSNRDAERCSVIFAYALGKSQRIISQLDQSIGPIGVHGAIQRYMLLYSTLGVKFPGWEPIDTHDKDQVARFKKGGIIIAPSSAARTSWLATFGDVATASASGWMAIRSPRRWQNLETGFVLSDHADWPGLLETIQATGAERIGITHGYVSTLVKYLQEQGTNAFPVPTQFRGDSVENEEPFVEQSSLK